MRKLFVVMMVAFGISSHAQASLIGDNVQAAVGFNSGPFTVTPASAIVGPGIEFTVSEAFPAFTVDIDASTITLVSDVPTSWVPGDFFELTSLNGVGDIIGFQLLNNGWSGLGVGNISVTPTSLKLDLSGTANDQTDQVVITLLFASAIIPEPATATLGLLSLGGLMLRRRRMA